MEIGFRPSRVERMYRPTRREAAILLPLMILVAGVALTFPSDAAPFELAAELTATESTGSVELTASIEVTDGMMKVIQLPAVVANEDYAVLGGFLGGLVLLAIYLFTLRLIDAQYLRVNRKDREAAIGGFLGADRQRRRKHGPGMKYSPLDRHDGSAARGYNSDSYSDDDRYDDRNNRSDEYDEDSDQNRNRRKPIFNFKLGNNRREQEKEREREDNRARDRQRRTRSDEDEDEDYGRPRNTRFNARFVRGGDEPSVWKRENSPPGSGQRGRYVNDSDRDDYDYDRDRGRRAAHRDPYEKNMNSPRSQPRRGGRRYISDEERDEDPRRTSRRPSSRSDRRGTPNARVKYARGAYRTSDYEDDEDEVTSPPLPPR